MGNLNLARNGGPRLHWSDTTPEQRAAIQARIDAERARVAQAEASGFTGDGIPLELVTCEPSEIEGCAEYNTVKTIDPSVWEQFTQWRENGKEVRLFRRRSLNV